MNPIYFRCVIGGYWSHIWVDMLNVRGANLFWPSPIRIVMPGAAQGKVYVQLWLKTSDPPAALSGNCASMSAQAIAYIAPKLALVLLLCGGDKPSQDADIDRPVECWQDYQTEHGSGQLYSQISYDVGALNPPFTPER